MPLHALEIGAHARCTALAWSTKAPQISASTASQPHPTGT